MLELLRDPAWQFVGVMLALAAVAVTVLVYWLQRQKKSLSYEVISKNELLTVREELEGRLQVLYEGQPARDICLLVVKLFNSGNVPVSASDYERPISLSTGASSKVLSGAVTAVDPENLAATIEIAESRVILDPILLNSKDSVTLKLLVSDFGGNLSVDGRVLGVRSISRTGETTGYLGLLLFFAFAFCALGSYFMVAYTPKADIRPPSPIEVKFGVGLFGMGYLLMLFVLVKSRPVRTVIRKLLRTARL